MKLIVFAVAMGLLTGSALAHDGGHGPKLNDVGKHGGVVTAVVLASERSLGPKAKLVYKSELVRLKDGTVRFYLYDQNMKPLNVNSFTTSGKGIVEFEKRKKTHELPFALKKDGVAFVGKAPRSPQKPFNIDIRVNEGKRTLLAAFDSLD